MKDLVYDYTMKHNTVAIVSDGTAVLGLGDIGTGGRHAGHGGQGALFKELPV
jgi:malate dehydrogenase (oxaloacetate-decarboxylating)